MVHAGQGHELLKWRRWGHVENRTAGFPITHSFRLNIKISVMMEV